MHPQEGLKERIYNIRKEHILEFAEQTGLFQAHDDAQIVSTIDFWAKNCLDLHGYIDFLLKNKVYTYAAVSFHSEESRKASTDPYFKHLFYCGYLLSEMSRSDSNSTAVIGLFHDAIELIRKREGVSRYTAGDFHQKMIEMELP